MGIWKRGNRDKINQGNNTPPHLITLACARDKENYVYDPRWYIIKVTILRYRSCLFGAVFLVSVFSKLRFYLHTSGYPTPSFVNECKEDFPNIFKYDM